MPVIKKKWALAASVEIPSTSTAVDSSKDAMVISNYVPDFAAFAQYEWAPGQHIRLSGILRTLPYRNLIQAENHTVMGMGRHAEFELRRLPTLHPAFAVPSA